MNRIQVYDLPTRILHWLFAGTFVATFFIAKTLEDDSPFFSYHMLLGLVLVGIVGLRVLLGIFGSRFARFSSLSLRPSELFQYFKQVLGVLPARSAGHNPASAWAAVHMWGLALGLAATGILMTSGGDKEAFEDVHEILANVFALTAILHVAGVSLHALRYRDSIGWAMIHGKKLMNPGVTGIASTHRGVGLLLLFLVGGLAFGLSRNYDSGTRTLSLLGATLHLGESETEEHPSERQSREQDHQDQDENRGNDKDD